MQEKYTNRNKQPNVVFIFPDQLGAQWTGTYGNPDVKTPYLDQLAEQGVLFERAYTASPLCTPYRGTLFTGRYPCQTGVVNNGNRLPNSEVTLANCFNQGGYHTAYIGKWHMSGPPGGNRWVPPMERAGFTEFMGWEGHHVDHWKGLIFEEENQPIKLNGHETDGQTDIVCERLEKLKGLKSPFCLFVSYQAPHLPCSPPDEYLKLYQNKPLQSHNRPNVDRSATYRNQFKNDQYNELWDLSKYTEPYFGEITHMDAAFGRIMSQLKQLELEDNTIVIFTSDHGEMAGSQGLFKKGVMYEEATHVPLVIRHPDGAKNKKTDHLFSSVDFLPTLLELCSLPPAPTSEGVSHASVILDRESEQIPRSEVFIQYKEQCIRTDQYKLITDENTEKPIALFDLFDDPYEMNNLATQPEIAAVVTKLINRLREWLKDMNSRTGDIEEASAKSPYFQ